MKGMPYGRKLRKFVMPQDFEEFKGRIRRSVNTACVILEQAAVQGPMLKPEVTAAKIRVFKNLWETAVAKGWLEEPGENDWEPYYVMVGFPEPETFKGVREPRPWQVPGWKSPWMKYKEYIQWQKKKEKEKEALDA